MSKTKSDIRIEDNTQRILDLISDGIYVSDRDGRTLHVNSMYERLTGLKKEELIGRPVDILLKEKKFDNILNPRIVKTGKPASSVQTDPKGNKLILNGYPIFDENDQVVLVVTFVRDITLMTQLKEQIAFQKQVIEKYKTNVRRLNEDAAQKYPIVSHSPEIAEIQNYIEKVAPTDATVLLQGETGVGKDVFARQIHRISNRADKPFLKVDCPTIPENLIESELFGYAPGAFSGAHSKGKLGFFEMADRSTLFLDEVGELPLSLQAKLLRVLQDQEIIRIGSTKTKKVDVRVIAATNRDLEEMVNQGEFRSDLYYRLRVAVVTIPPLRTRPDDILPLAHYFLSQYAARYKKMITFETEVEAVFQRYEWPGNVRELENLTQSLVVSSDEGTIGVNALPSKMVAHATGDPCRKVAMDALAQGQDARETPIDKKGLYRSLIKDGRSLKDIVAEVEREIIEGALDFHNSTSEAAKHLQIDRSTLFRKLKRGQDD